MEQEQDTPLINRLDKKKVRFAHRRRRARVHKLPYQQDQRASQILTQTIGVPQYVICVDKKWYLTENPYDVSDKQPFDTPAQLLGDFLLGVRLLAYLNKDGVECVVRMK